MWGICDFNHKIVSMHPCVEILGCYNKVLLISISRAAKRKYCSLLINAPNLVQFLLNHTFILDTEPLKLPITSHSKESDK